MTHIICFYNFIHNLLLYLYLNNYNIKRKMTHVHSKLILIYGLDSYHFKSGYKYAILSVILVLLGMEHLIKYIINASYFRVKSLK